MDGPYILLSCDIQLKWIVSVNLNSIDWIPSQQQVQDGCQRWGGVRGFHGGGHLHRCHRHGNRSLNHPCCLQSSGTLNLDKPSCVTFSCYLDSLLISSPKYTISIILQLSHSHNFHWEVAFSSLGWTCVHFGCLPHQVFSNKRINRYLLTMYLDKICVTLHWHRSNIFHPV